FQDCGLMGAGKARRRSAGPDPSLERLRRRQQRAIATRHIGEAETFPKRPRIFWRQDEAAGSDKTMFLKSDRIENKHRLILQMVDGKSLQGGAEARVGRERTAQGGFGAGDELALRCGRILRAAEPRNAERLISDRPNAPECASRRGVVRQRNLLKLSALQRHQ